MKRREKMKQRGWGKRQGQKGPAERQKGEDTEAKESSGEVQERKAASD